MLMIINIFHMYMLQMTEILLSDGEESEPGEWVNKLVSPTLSWTLKSHPGPACLHSQPTVSCYSNCIGSKIKIK